MEKVSANNRAVGGERMLKKVMPCQVLSKLSKIAEEVDDKRQRDSGRKIAAAAEDRRVGRPTCTACTGIGRSTGRSTATLCLQEPKLSGFLGRPLGRQEEEVGRPSGRPTVGSERKTAAPEIWVFKPKCNF